MATADHRWESVVRGHHVYKAIWTPEIGEILECKQERDNPKDLCAVSVIEDDTIVGHVPRKKSCVVWYFFGAVTCEVTDRRKRGKGLEVPCLSRLTIVSREAKKSQRPLSELYHFTGKKKKIEKLRKLLPPAQQLPDPPA